MEITKENSQKINLFGLTLMQLEQIVAEQGLPKFTARQITDWLYKKGVVSISDMTNLSMKGRALLAEKYHIDTPPPVKVTESSDGTKKYLFKIDNHKLIEAAYIPDKDRDTLCISSQAGCKMGCLFCMTGKQGFQGNLTAGEIVNQLRSIPEWRSITNIVYMGMGEPFDNIENVLQSLEILTSPWGMEMSPRRITVSTIGIIPAMEKFLKKSECHLAISLHTPFDEERKNLMPVQNRHPIDKVVDTLKRYDFSGQRRVSFEYIMFDRLNDSTRHINGIVRLLHGLRCRLNLIQFHPIPGVSFVSSPEQQIIDFRDKLTSKGVITTIRASRGLDIQAACGLLSTKESGNIG